MTRFVLVALAALLLSTAAHAHGVTAGDIEIIHPAIPAPPASAISAAGYMAIANTGSEADTLVGIETGAAARVMLHGTEHGADGVARMAHIPAIEIPAGETVLLVPGGMHVMLMGLAAPLVAGDMVPATLVFDHAGRVAIEFMVDPPNGADHGTMDHAAKYPAAAPRADGPMSVPGGSDAE
ncbi:MAG: copper chaperone PCu(A)C [Mangrovicoccus sp.]|nr:copper chaperone PCu(A)C [Mangrovicoccus sp.]